MFKVLDSSCHHIWVRSSYTLHLIYLSTTTGCRRAKPLHLQSAAQDSPHHRNAEPGSFQACEATATQQHSNPAHVYEVKQAGREPTHCSLSTCRYSLIFGSLWRCEWHSWLSSLSSTHLSDSSSVPAPFRDEAGDRDSPYEMDNCFGIGYNHHL